MEGAKLTARLPVYTLFIATSFFVGWFIPAFYQWTDSDQSRPSPLLWKVPLSVAMASVLFCMVLPWLPLAMGSPGGESRTPFRFSVRMILMLTSGIAVAIATIAAFPRVGTAIVCLSALAYFLSFVVQYPEHRAASVALIACMILPFAWVLGYTELDRLLPALAWGFAGLPALAPAMLSVQLIGQNPQEFQWLAYLMTALELAIGICVVRLGTRPTIAYLMLAMQISAFGSLAFYQLCRM